MKHLERLIWMIATSICFFGWIIALKNSEKSQAEKVATNQTLKDNRKKMQAVNSILNKKDSIPQDAIEHAVANIKEAIDSARDSIVNSKSDKTSSDTSYQAVIKERDLLAGRLKEAGQQISVKNDYSQGTYTPATDTTPAQFNINKFTVHIIPKNRPVVFKRFLGLRGTTSIVTDFTSDNPIVDFDGAKTYTYVQHYPQYNNRIQVFNNYNVIGNQFSSGIILRHDFKASPVSINISAGHNWMLKTNSFTIGTNFDVFK